MKELIFRAKEITKGTPGKWVYGDYFSQHKDGQTKHYIVEHPYGRDNGREIMWEVDGETRGELTDQKDISGLDIYEDDLVRDERGFVYVVEFTANFFHECIEYAPRLELVGNRTDTPELVEAA